jgi:5'-nucleotidase / UDP-sugar diphosphatase
MKTTLTLLLLLITTAFTVNAQTVKKITVLHTNDLHSHFQGFAPESDYTPLTTGDDKTIGGFSRIAAIISREKATNPEGTIVVDAGDCMMGTMFHTMELYSGFELRLMKKAGYDVMALGNHDFDLGPARYARMVNIAASEGQIPELILSNAVTDPTDVADDSFEELFDTRLLKKYTIVEREGIRIGLFSLIGKDADESAPYAVPVTFASNIKTARHMVEKLKEQGCGVIICLSHSGVTLTKEGKWDGEDVELARNVKGIDLIVSGHTHTLLEKPIMVEGIPIVQVEYAGKYVGEAEFSWDGKKATFDSYKLIPVNDNIAGDPEIQSLIDEQEKKVDFQVLKPLGLTCSMPVARASFPLTCEEYGDVASSNLGQFVADAVYSYSNGKGDGADIAVTAAGIIRDPVLPGIQCVADIFRVMSLGSGNDGIPGYPLSKIYVTGRELKNIIEALLMTSASTPSNYCYYSHLKVTYDPRKGLFNKVTQLELTDKEGHKSIIDTSKKNKRLYSVTSDSYMLDNISLIKKKSFGLLNVVPKDKNGESIQDMKTAIMDFDSTRNGIQEGKEWLAIIYFLNGNEGQNSAALPVIPVYYMSPDFSTEKVTK